MSNVITQSPLFGLVLTILAFEFGKWLNRKTGLTVANPMLVATVIVIAVLKLLNIPVQDYDRGARFITLLLVPATACLGLGIYLKIETLKKNLLPVICGVAVGSAVAMGSVWGMSVLFGLTDELKYALLPKSITVAFAMPLAEQLGGVVPVTILGVMITGVFGGIAAPFLVRTMRLRNPVAEGIAIGTCSHGIGTAKALELGDVQGAMSGIAMGLAGIVTVIYCVFL